MYTHDGGFWNVFSDLDRLFDQVGRNPGANRRGIPSLGAATPALNVWGNDEALVVTSEIPGVDPASVGITVHGDTLTVKGKRVVAPAQEQQPERSAEFQRSIQLPYRIDAERTAARCRDGVLSISLHRIASDKPRSIAITAS
jgi:HSP20 family protein